MTPAERAAPLPAFVCVRAVADISGEDFRTAEEQRAIEAQEMTPWLVREFCPQPAGEVSAGA